MKLSEVFLLYFTSLDGVRSPATLSTYKCKSSTITKIFGDIQVDDITPVVAQKFFDDLLPKYSCKTVCSFLDVTRAAFKCAVKADMVEYNPFSDVHIENDKIFTPLILNSEEIKRILEAVRYDSALFLPVFIATHTGLKRTEVLNLTWGNIDFSKAEIAYESVRVSSKNHVYIVGGARVNRTVSMNSELASILLTVKETRRNKGIAVTDNDRVCLTKGYQVMEASYFDKCFRAFVKAHKELPQNLRFHDFHWFYINNKVLTGNNVVPNVCNSLLSV